MSAAVGENIPDPLIKSPNSESEAVAKFRCFMSSSDLQDCSGGLQMLIQFSYNDYPARSPGEIVEHYAND